MFTSADRADLRDALIHLATADTRISGVALTGSVSIGQEDDWSDIDLAFGVKGDLSPVIQDFTAFMRDRGAVHWFEVPSGAWIYRVFLMSNTLQVDLAFAPEPDFGARAPSFKLLFGEAHEQPHVKPPPPASLVDWGWLFALHVRSSLARGRSWQALHMLNALRENVIALMCLRHDLPWREGRGVDKLPEALKTALGATLPSSRDSEEIGRAFAEAAKLLIAEAEQATPELAEKLRSPLASIASAV
ncbi:MAG: nucleotidyltransferase domain-containing protein [Armatimonadetes bacterium]|nr:nucleotidyltransferase domain-containing protein [Armatimonadota bacterium]